jgi:hypothetical protein
MAHALQFDAPADEHFYRQLIAEIGDRDPKGLVVHLVVRHDGMLRHFEVWESKEDWERFRDEQVGPALTTLFTAMGLPESPPRPPEGELELVDVWVGTKDAATRPA